MKKLSKMLMTYWYSYENELIDFGMLNFFTGKTAAGKSTIIDALQLMLLGDTQGTYFNKAANKNANRTLKSYLYWQNGDDGSTGYNYLRKGPFTSYIALEFMDTETDTPFTICFVADCYADLQYDYKWVVLTHSGIPDNHFVDVKTNVPLSIQDLKSYLNNEIGRKNYDICDTNRQYREQLRARFGNVNGKYFTLLRKAVPFTPIADIEKFITESICDIHNEIVVEDMQSDILIYKRLEDDARRTQDKISVLEAIHNDSDNYEKAQDTLLQQEYIVERAGQEEAREEERKFRDEATRAENKLKEYKSEIGELEKQIAELTAKTEKAETEYHSSDLRHRQQSLEERIEEAGKKIDECQKALTDAFAQIRNYGNSWKKQLWNLRGMNLGAHLDQTKTVRNDENYKESDMASAADTYVDADRNQIISTDDTELINSMADITESGIESFDFERCADSMRKLSKSLNDEASALKVKLRNLRQDITLLGTQVKNLEKGIKPYPEYVLHLKALLSGVTDVRILADLLEVRDSSWQDAIEGYLDRQKFYLLVPEKDYRKALHIYDEARKELGIYDAGLIDIGKLRRDQEGKTFATPGAGSLSEEIETDDPDARLYIDYLLGNVMKCESVDELNKYRIGITRSVMLYKGYVSRRINPARYQDPFIGRRSMEQQLATKRALLQEKSGEEQKLANEYRLISNAAEEHVLSEFEAKEHRRAVEAIPSMHEEEKKRQDLQTELDGLDFTWLDKLRASIDDMKHRNADMQSRKQNFNNECIKMEIALARIQNENLPDIMNRLSQIADAIAAKYQDEWIRSTGEPRFERENGRDSRSQLSLKDSFARQIVRTRTEMDLLHNTLVQRRSEYNGIYKMGHDVNAAQNTEYDDELAALRDIKLPDYIEKIKDSKTKAYNQFRDDFIAKLKSNIETVRQQIDELNASVRAYQFGSDQYHFTIAPRAEYRGFYDMIMDPMLMDTGDWNIASQSFNDKYQKEIDELFRMLIWDETETSSERREEYEKNIKKFTDYKTYVVFDLVVKGEDGTEQRLSRTLGSKSGGETQIPFYIALLASFSQVCRVRSRNKNNTIRVIILDEAFSKMDGERIQESVKMLRKFGLQAVFSAPPDKIPDIAPLVDRNIVVYKDGGRSFTRHFDPAEIDEVSDEIEASEDDE